MKFIFALPIALLAVGVMSCSQPDVVVTPNSYSGAKGGSGGGGGGSTTPPSSTTTPAPTTLPTLAPNPDPIYDLGPIMPTGTWSVKSYYRSFSLSTSDFKACKLVFSSTGLVTATDAKGNSATGSWYATKGGSVTYYGYVSTTVTALTMNFGKSASKPFDRLSATWNVNIATTSTDVVLDNYEPLAGERIEFSL